MRAKDILPDDINEVQVNDVAVRKGTVGAFLINSRLWLKPDASPEERAAAEEDILEALPALVALGLFDFLSIRNPKLSELVAMHI
ncbi:hypothetical protein [Phyllobacterium myrsinacearum]|uniref:Preprotein translocase subunit SecD n=1 Tax=Phyllobacterium myrsinacearum TaxID=28101 RepID=A0A839EE12_9HYPH|nr:hypothetical protein [Phyllobacterium myrsinacearum]MBA8876565.1 hypothetical protein [Phyllobacterium myrsinacearum]